MYWAIYIGLLERLKKNVLINVAYFLIDGINIDLLFRWLLFKE